MADVVAITHYGELPRWWQDQWHECRRVYERHFAGRKTRRWCEQAAFEDIRRAYLEKMAQVMLSHKAAPAD